MLKHLVWVGVIGVAFAVAVVAGATPPANTALPSIDDPTAVVGQTLNGSDGTWDVDPPEDSRTREWVRCDPSCALGAVVGSGTSYVVRAGDLNKTLVYRVTVTNADGPIPADSSPAAVAVGPLHRIVISPSTASIVAGGSQAYTAEGFDSADISLGDVTGSTEFTTPLGSCAAASCSATSTGSHTVTGTNAGKTHTASLAVTPGPLHHLVLSPASATIPAGGSQAYVADGRDQYDNSLGNVTATTTFTIAPDGNCPGGGPSCTASTPGGHTVTGTKDGKTGTATLTMTPVGPENTAPPAVNDLTPAVGQTLTYTAGTWTGAPPPSVTRQWCTPGCAAVLGTGASYTVLAADVGKQVIVRETAVNSAGTVTADSAATAQITGPPTTTTVPTIDTTAPVRGQTLVGSSGLWAAWPPPALVHQWSRCTVSGSGTTCSPGGTFSTTPVSAAPSPFTNTSSYVVTDADLGSRLRLTVTASNSAGAAAPLNSVPTQPVQGAPANLSGQGPIVSGTLVRGQTLTATSGKWTGYWQGTAPVSFTHQWQRCNAGGGACVNVNAQPPIAVSVPANVTTCTSLAPCDATSSYALSDADMGSTIRVIVQASNGGGTSGNVTSAATGIVNGAPQILQANGVPDPNAVPKINGLAQSGLNIGASSGSWSAFPEAITYAYQWVRCSGTDVGSCSAIAGATATVYAVQDADVGQRLRIRITASNGVDPPGVAHSDPTEPVKARSAGIGGNGVDLLLSAKANSAGGKLTYTLTATNAGNQGASGVVITATPPAGVTIVSATAPGGCSGAGPVTCALGALGPGANAAATIVIQATQTGVVSFAASVGAAEADVNPTNNAVSLTTFLVVTGSTPQANDGTRGQVAGDGTVIVNPDGSVALNAVKLKARRIGKTWTVATTFTLVAGNAKIRLAVTKNGSVKVLTLLKGSRLGGTIASANRTQLALDTAKPATFPIKIVLPAGVVSPAGIYVIHITATSATGATSKLDLGFKAVNLVSKKATATRSGSAWVASSTFSLPARKTAVQAWVSRGASAKKLTLLKGSRLGTVQAKAGKKTLLLQAPRAGTFPVRVVLPEKGFSLKETYVIRMEAKSATGLWTDYEVRFKGKAPARLLTGTRATP